MSAEAANPALELEAVAPEGRPNYARLALVGGLTLLGLSAWGLWQGVQAGDPRPFLGWLLGASFWLSIGIGMLFLVMLTYVFDAGWSIVIRRQWEHALAAFKWLAVIFLPLLALSFLQPGNGAVAWNWLDAAKLTAEGHPVGHDPLFLAKSAYLDGAFFLGRFALFFAIWVFLSEALRRCSFAMDRDGDHENVHRARRLAALGIVLCALATTFAAIDFFKSLEYHWFSTMYGVWFFSASMRAALSATVLVCFFLADRGHLRGIFQPAHSYLLGCLMLAFTVFWAYISFSQYFLIYNANIPEETFWYVIREQNPDGHLNSWWWVSMGLIFGHFLLPFLYLLFYRNKFGGRILVASAFILVFHLLDLYWNIVPAKIHDPATGGYLVRQFSVNWVDLTVLLGTGGVCAWAFLTSAARHQPIPLRDPRILESLHPHE